MLEGFKLESGRELERIQGTPNEIISELSLSSDKIKIAYCSSLYM